MNRLKQWLIWSLAGGILLSLSACIFPGTETGNPGASCLAIQNTSTFSYELPEVTLVFCDKLLDCGLVTSVESCEAELLEDSSTVLSSIFNLQEFGNFDTALELQQGLQSESLRINVNTLALCDQDLQGLTCDSLAGVDLSEAASWDWLPDSCQQSLEAPVDGAEAPAGGDSC